MPILSVEYLYFAHPMAAKHLGVGFGRWSGPTLAIMNSRLPFRANLENWYRWLTCASVRGLVCRVGMNVTLAHIFLPFYLNRWKSTTHGFIPSKLGELTSLTQLSLSTWIGWSSCLCECHPCLQFLAILFVQGIINSRVPCQANSEKWRPWLSCGSVRELVYLFLMNVSLAHISSPCCTIRAKWFEWWLRSNLLWWITFEVVEFLCWLLFWS